jgi:hypothetical protein
MNFVHTIKVLSVWYSNANNHNDSVFIYLYILRSFRFTELEVKSRALYYINRLVISIKLMLYG